MRYIKLKGKKMANSYATLLNKVRENRPLVHHITNYVTVNDCANITIAIGASPLMAAVAAMMCMDIAGELAYKNARKRGNGSFRIALHDAVSCLDAATLEKLAKYYEE
jgi:hydroxyethylthiazole kinase-like sugar kinase family protein